MFTKLTFQNPALYGDKGKASRRPFLERVATFQWDRYYTRWVRVTCHLTMWLVFTSLLQFNLFVDSDLPLHQATAFAVRSVLCNMTVFYLFFYVIVPQTLLKNHIVPAVFSFIACIYLWILMNHFLLLFIAAHFEVKAAYYSRGLRSNQAEGIWYVLSFRNFFAGLIPVFYSISPYFFAKIVFNIVRSYSRLFTSERKALNLEVEKLNLERDFLKSQLNPHFLFNTLNNLYGLSLRKDELTPQVITQLSEMMRYTLYESNAEMVPVAKELQYLKNYVQLEKMRYKDNANIVFEIDDSSTNGQMIAPLLTFTFVENAFKYGLKKKKAGFLRMKISIDPELFYFSVVNDKREKENSSEFAGIGLRNTKKRLELLYPGKHTLAIEDGGNDFSVELTINFQ